MKKLLAMLLVLAMISCLFVACANNDSETDAPTTAPTDESKTNESTDNSDATEPDDNNGDVKIAMITDYGDITDQSFNQTTYEACQKFAGDNGYDFKYYKPTDNSTAGRVASTELAIADGYNVIVMPGYAFGGTIVEVAPQYPNVKFIALDVAKGDLLEAAVANAGETYDYNPDNWNLADYVDLSNVYCAVYQEELSGYMAGYAAVCLGYTKLGFLGGMAVPAVIRFGYGFVQGVDAAAAAKGVEGVEVNYIYGGQFNGDGDITAVMDTWYSNGTHGSAAGSIVSYSLGITQLDPIRYQLLFERFLNPERVSMPDIDIDFCFERRQEVIDYVVRKYGKDRVVQIVTFGTMAARGVIRDVGRVLDFPYAQVDTIAKMIPNELNITIDKALKMNPELRNQYEGDEQIHYLIDMSKRLEGLPRHTSMHAAGVVISQKAVDEYVPLSRASDGSITTQFTMTTLEELGLLKMDFLGLRTLTVIQNAVKLAQKSEGIELDLSKIDYNDQAVLGMIGSGKCEGVFQLESTGMKNFMKELKPKSLEDIIAGISLYRPGPMDFIPQYIKGKNAPDQITYDCPQLEPILEPTYGCIVYQEQVMQIVRDLAGYTLGRSDLVRRAMAKKKAAVMAKERENFVYGNEEEGVPGCIANGISEQVANKIYDEMTDFAKYAFNKSHAAAYAVVSYQTAWLKYYYPVEFMAALMTSCIDNPSKVSEYILNCRQMGIRILPPDINRSTGSFSVEDGSIRYGMAAVKGIGKPVMEAIVEERERGGLFSSLKDFCRRLSGKEVNKRTIENFIKAGAFDSFGGTRKQFMMIYVQVMDTVNQEKKSSMTGQMSLFDIMGEEDKKSFEIRLPDVGEYAKESKLAFEKEVLGVYISGHPLEEYADVWKKNITAATSDFYPMEESGLPKVRDGAKVIVGGMITEKTIKYTKNNKVMAFITLEDLVGTVEVVVFPRDYERNAALIETDSKVFIMGNVSAEDDKASKLICEKIVSLDQVPRELWIQFADRKQYEQEVAELYDTLRQSDGSDHVVVYLRAEKQMKHLPASRSVEIEDNLLGILREKYGAENVKVVEKSIEKQLHMH